MIRPPTSIAPKENPPLGSARQRSFDSEEFLPYLQELNFNAFQHCVTDLLCAMEYQNIRTLGRRHWKGRNKRGGPDLVAYSQAGLNRSKVLIQIKRYRRPVQKRFVDELRGLTLSYRADKAMLFTTSTFPPVAHRAARAGCHIAPVALVDGEALTALLIQHGIGITRVGKEELAVDTVYFANLRSAYPDKKVVSRSKTASGLNKADEQPIPGYPHNDEQFMQWRTHVLLGISSLWLLAALPAGIGTNTSADNLGVLATVAAIGALLPDLDSTQSKISRYQVSGIRPLAPLSSAVHQAWGHRGPLHSLIGVGLISLVSAFLFLGVGWQVALAIWLGYVSHLAADSCTKSGIPLVPGHAGRFHLLPPGWRISTGSPAEDLLLPFLVAAVFGLLLTRLLHGIS